MKNGHAYTDIEQNESIIKRINYKAHLNVVQPSCFVAQCIPKLGLVLCLGLVLGLGLGYVIEEVQG